MIAEDIKARVRKLLALATDGGATESEAENAMRFAQSLMDKHHLSSKDVAPEKIRFCSADYKGAANLHAWERRLAWAVAKTVGTVQWYHCREREHKSYVTIITFYGPADDVALAYDMYETMRIVMMTMAYSKYNSAFAGDGRSYCMGFADVLYRVPASHVRTQECTDLIRVRSELARTWLEKNAGIDLVIEKPRLARAKNADAYMQGRIDGKSQNLSAITKKIK